MALPDRPSTRVEILIGLALAVCIHPVAAWHSQSPSARVLFFMGYFIASYLSVLVALQFLTL